METLAQDIWSGLVDIDLDFDAVSLAPQDFDDQEGDTEVHSPSNEQKTHVRQDTPVPNSDDEDKGKMTLQAPEQTTSREATPIPLRRESWPTSTSASTMAFQPSSSRLEPTETFPEWDGPTRCPYHCRSLLENQEEYVEHMRKHNGKSYFCEAPGCQNVYIHLRSLRRHQRMIHGDFQHGVCVKWAES